MSGNESFEFAAAVAGVCIGLGALLLFSLVAIIGAWQVFRRSGEAAQAAARAAVGVEELARHVSAQLVQPRAETGQLGDLREQGEALLQQQRQLQEMAQHLLDTAAAEALLQQQRGPQENEAGAPQAPLRKLEASIKRVEASVEQIAVGLSNFIQIRERER